MKSTIVDLIWPSQMILNINQQTDYINLKSDYIN